MAGRCFFFIVNFLIILLEYKWLGNINKSFLIKKHIENYV